MIDCFLIKDADGCLHYAEQSEWLSKARKELSHYGSTTVHATVGCRLVHVSLPSGAYRSVVYNLPPRGCQGSPFTETLLTPVGAEESSAEHN